MSASWWLGNLVAYSVQVALVVAAGGLAAAVLRLKQPRVMLAYWQALLAACLLLPLAQVWQRTGSSLAPAAGTATIIGIEARDVGSALGLFPFHAWVFTALVAGVGLGLLRLALGLWRLGHYRRVALRIAPLPGVLREARALVATGAAFYFSELVESPVTFGWLNPAIILPTRFQRMEESQQRAIACHELLHVARRDWLVNLFEEFILACLWFHPALWWVMRSIRLAREQVVDSRVVALTGARKPYLDALLEIAIAVRAMPVPAPLFLAESQLARRVASLAKEVRMSKPRLVASLAIALAVLVATAWWAVKTFWLISPAGSPTGMVAYGSVNAPGSEGASAFVFYMVNDGDRSGFSARTVDGVQIKGPLPISMPLPPYTPQARRDKVEGAVLAAVDVDASGSVTGVNLAAVSLSRNLSDGLDESVMQALRTWKFQPAIKQGRPVPAKVTVHITFRLS
jgi:TonB family protein